MPQPGKTGATDNTIREARNPCGLTSDFTCKRDVLLLDGWEK